MNAKDAYRMTYTDYSAILDLIDNRVKCLNDMIADYGRLEWSTDAWEGEVASLELLYEKVANAAGLRVIDNINNIGADAADAEKVRAA